MLPCSLLAEIIFSKLLKMKILITKSTKIVQLVLRKLVKKENFDYVINDQTPPPPPYSQCNKGQARAQNFFSPISINLVPKVASRTVNNENSPCSTIRSSIIWASCALQKCKNAEKWVIFCLKCL